MQENEQLHFCHIPWFWKATPHERRTTRLKRLTWNFSHQIFRAALTNAGLLPKRAMPQRPWRPWHRYHLIRVINCQPVYVMQPCIPIVYTLPETKIAPENGWLEDDPFLLGWPIFRCYVSFREGILLLWKLWMLFKKTIIAHTFAFVKKVLPSWNFVKHRMLSGAKQWHCCNGCSALDGLFPWIRIRFIYLQ